MTSKQFKKFLSKAKDGDIIYISWLPSAEINCLSFYYFKNCSYYDNSLFYARAYWKIDFNDKNKIILNRTETCYRLSCSYIKEIRIL